MECGLGELIMNKLIRVVGIILLCCVMMISVSTMEVYAKENCEEKIVVDLGDGIGYEYYVERDTLSTERAAYKYTSDTSYGRFFIIATDETVANTQLKVYFKYDGTEAEAYKSDPSCEAVKADYSVSFSETTYESGKTASGSAVFTLYLKGEYRNSCTAIVYCTGEGKTSSVLN